MRRPRARRFGDRGGGVPDFARGIFPAPLRQRSRKIERSRGESPDRERGCSALRRRVAPRSAARASDPFARDPSRPAGTDPREGGGGDGRRGERVVSCLLARAPVRRDRKFRKEHRHLAYRLHLPSGGARRLRRRESRRVASARHAENEKRKRRGSRTVEFSTDGSLPRTRTRRDPQPDRKPPELAYRHGGVPRGEGTDPRAEYSRGLPRFRSLSPRPRTREKRKPSVLARTARTLGDRAKRGPVRAGRG